MASPPPAVIAGEIPIGVCSLPLRRTDHNLWFLLATCRDLAPSRGVLPPIHSSQCFPEKALLGGIEWMASLCQEKGKDLF